MARQQKVIHINSGEAGKLPTGSTIGVEKGEIAVNHNLSNPFLTIRTGTGYTTTDFAKFSADDTVYAEVDKKLTNMVTNTGTSTSGNFPVFDGTTGKLIKNSSYNSNSFATKSHTHGTATLTGEVTGSANFNNTGTSISTTIAGKITAGSSITSSSTGLTQGKAVHGFVTDTIKSEVDALTTVIEDNERVTAAALTVLDGRVVTLEGYSHIPEDHADTSSKYGLATSGTSGKYGHVRLMAGDLKPYSASTSYSNGVAAAHSHTHSQYVTSGHTHSASDITGTTKLSINVIPTGTSSTTVAAGNHGHAYAGSSTTGGSATSAVKLDTTTAGTATQPVYFSGGKPVACTYTLGASVPSGALFTDTHLTSKNVVASGGTLTGNTKAANGNVYLNHTEDDVIKSSHKIVGSGSVTVTADSAGTITISGTDNDTHHAAYLRTASSTTSTANTTDTANGVYFNLVENNAVRSNTLVSGATNITVTSPTAGTILITGPSLTGYSQTSHTHTSTAITDFNTAVNGLIDSRLAENDAMIYKGTLTTASTLPTAGNAGWTYKMSQQGTLYGQKVEVGDMVICGKDYTSVTISSSNFATYYSIIETNHDGCVSGPGSATSGNFAVFDGTTGKVIKDSTYKYDTFAKNCFSKVNGGGTTIEADSTGDTLTITGSTFITVSGDATNDKVTISANTGTTSSTLARGDHSHTAYVNQNAFSNVKVGTTTIAADSATDTLEIVAGNFITLTPDATNDKVTIAVNTGTSSTTVAAGNHGHSNYATTGHTHSASDITGTTKLSINVIPTGTSSSTVARGDHSHSNYATTSALEALSNEVVDNEEAIAAALTVLNANMIDNEEVVASALADLDERVIAANASVGATTNSSKLYLVGVTATGESAQSYVSAPYMENNAIHASGGFYQNSDESLKNFINDVEVDLDKIAELPKKYFTWVDENMGEGVQVGTSAQELQKLYPELVKVGKDGTLTVEYSKLSILALKAIDVLNAERKEMKKDIEMIKEKLGL